MMTFWIDVLVQAFVCAFCVLIGHMIAYKWRIEQEKDEQESD